MNRLKVGFVAGFLALFIFACAQTQNSKLVVENNNSAVTKTTNAVVDASPAADELAAARKIYSEACVKCHKADGAGGVTVVEGKNIKAPNLTVERQKKKPDSDYIEIIENGALDDGMPAFKGKIGDDDIKNLVKYIRKEFQGK